MIEEPNGSARGKETVLNPEVRFLDARQVQVSRDAYDRIRVTIGSDETYEKVKLARAFPLSNPDQYLSFLKEDGKEIGMLTDLKRLDASSQRVIQEEMDLIYYTPVIQRIYEVESKHGAMTWRFQTNRGDTTVHVKDRGEVRRLPNRRVLFTDVHGIKYDLPDYSKLDERSVTLLEGEV